MPNINLGANVIPAINKTYSLGSNAKRWNLFIDAINGQSLEGGKIPPSLLPSYVDDVIEGYYYNNKFYTTAQHTTEITGETGKIYINIGVSGSPPTYRWTGTQYLEIASQDTWKQNTASSEGYVLKGSGHANQVWKTDADGVPAWRNDGINSSADHYTPQTAQNQEKSAAASGGTAAWNIDVVTGVTLQTDGKGHVTGISVDSGKIPANPNTHWTTHLYAGTGTAANATTTNGNTKLTVADNTTVRDSITIKGTGASSVSSEGGVISIYSKTITAGVGLSGGEITSTGAVKVSLKSETASTLEAGTISATANRQYAVTLDSKNHLSVNVPWVAYTFTNGLSNSNNTISNSGVRSVEADSNGKIKVNTNGTSSTITVYTHPDADHLPSGGVAGQWVTFKNNAPAWSALPTASTSVAGIIKIGTGSTNAAAGNHSHALSLTQEGSSTINLVANTTYTLTAGGQTLVFKTPADNNNNTTYTFATGGTNGTFKYTPSGGSATEVAIKGLGSAAYTDSTAYATASHTHTLALAADSGTSAITLAAGTKYKLTAGGKTLIFTTPADNNNTYSAGTGLTLSGTTFSISKANVSTIINLLDTASSAVGADDYIITQYVGGGTTNTNYYRRPASKLVNSTLVKAALGTTTGTSKFLREDGTWQPVGVSGFVAQTGDTMTGSLYINVTGDKSAATGTDGALIIGNKTGANLSFDDNEIMARNNKVASTLYINNDGGTVEFGGPINVKGTSNNTFSGPILNSNYGNAFGATLSGKEVWGTTYSSTQSGGSQLGFRQWNDNNYHETYWLPGTMTGLTKSTSYNILTDKSVVSIPQGGTGANSRLGAAKNLTNEAVSSPDYIVGLTSSWGKFGFTSIAQLKTTLGLGTMAAETATNYVPKAGNTTMTGSLTIPTLTVTGAGGFNYNGIESASANSLRPVWFGNQGDTGTPVYNTNFQYNPAYGQLQIKYTGTGLYNSDVSLYNGNTGATFTLRNGHGSSYQGLYSDKYWDGSNTVEDGDFILYRGKDGKTHIPKLVVDNSLEGVSLPSFTRTFVTNIERLSSGQLMIYYDTVEIYGWDKGSYHDTEIVYP